MRYAGRTWTRREIEARTGALEQIGGLRRLRRDDGPEDGGGLIEVRTGGGLRYLVTPHKGLDIALAEFAGTPLSWQAGNGDVHPAYYDAGGDAWLRTASGGLLMTCGLTTVGSPGTDAGEALGLHGRIHHTPARQVAAEGEWEGDDYHMRVGGLLTETSLFGHSLTLQRAIRSTLGENRIAITDTVRNAGFAPAPLQLLYHVNLGFPLLEAGARIELPETPVRHRHPGTPVMPWQAWPAAPQAGCAEQVTLHGPCAPGWAQAAVANPGFRLADGTARPLRLVLAWDAAALPTLVQWRMPGEGAHVLGLEPSLSGVANRAQARADGSLVLLAPGEERVFRLVITIETC